MNRMKMNKRGQAMTIGGFVGIFVVVVVGIALFTGSAANVGTTSNQVDVVNETITAPATGSTLDLVGQEILGNAAVVTNATNASQIVPTTNYTITEAVSTSTGVKTVLYTSLAGTYSGEPVNITRSYGADGYIDSSGGRSLASLILIFFALAIMVVVLVPAVRSIREFT